MSAHELPRAPHPEGPRPKRPGTRLAIAGLSADGSRLLLLDDAGAEFTVDVDDRLRSALRGDNARLGQLEIRMDSTLRPRDIQARIRSGESPEAVAAAAQTSLERIMPYAAPVLAEREHVAERAQRSSIRRPHREGAPRTLGEAVAAQLRGLNVDPATAEWDAWRREDGRWSLIAAYTTTSRAGCGEFTFDQPGNFVTLDNDDARWLVGDLAAAPAPEPSRNDLADARARRLSAVPLEEQLPLDAPLGEDALDMVADREPSSEPALDTTVDLAETADAIRELGYEQPVEAFLDAEPAGREGEERALEDEVADAIALDEDPVPEQPDQPAKDPAADEPPSRRPVRKTRGRASVPSWDEIMFGGGSTD